MKKPFLWLASAAFGLGLIGLWIDPPNAAIQDWSTTASSNNSSSPNGFPEGMAPSGVNNSAREVMAQIRRWAEQIISGTHGATTGEAVNAYSITPDIYPSALTPGATYIFQASTTNTGTATLDVASIGAKTILRDGSALSSGDITENDWIEVVYDGSQFQIVASSGPIGTIEVSGGGTGASTLTDGGVLLGSGTGAISAMAVLSDSEMIVGDGSTDPVAESGATLRTSIGVGTGDSPQFTGIELGHASDTTIVRSGSGDLTIEGNAVYRAGGTDVPVGDGGTGASTLTDGGVLLGSGTSGVTATAVLTDGQMLVGDGSTDPSIESGATLRTSIGVGTGDNVQFTQLTATGPFSSLGIEDNASSNAITISIDEEVTMPSQPAFRARSGANQTNGTGDGTVLTIVFGTEIFDQNNDFDGVSTFTAPVSGKYHCDVGLNFDGSDGNQTALRMKLVTSNRTIELFDIRDVMATASGAGGISNNILGGSVLTDFDASDTATVTYTGAGTSKTLDVYADESTFFSCFLVA